MDGYQGAQLNLDFQRVFGENNLVAVHCHRTLAAVGGDVDDRGRRASSTTTKPPLVSSSGRRARWLPSR